MIPFWWACWIAWQTGTNSSSRWRGVRRLSSQYLVIGTPLTSSMTKYGRPDSVAPASRTRAMFTNDEPVQACPPSARYRLSKFARRNKRLLVSLALVALALVAGTVVSTWEAVRATKAEGLAQSRLEAEKDAREETDEARKKTEEERDRAVRAEGNATTEAANAKEQGLLARHRYCAAQLHLAQQALEAGNIARTLDLLETQRPKFDAEDLRTVEWYYLWQECHRGHRLTLQGRKGETRISPSGGPTRCLAISPDGRTLAAGGWDRYVRLWDIGTGRLLAILAGHS
jgi:hypothetical protein